MINVRLIEKRIQGYSTKINIVTLAVDVIDVLRSGFHVDQR